MAKKKLREHSLVGFSYIRTCVTSNEEYKPSQQFRITVQHYGTSRQQYIFLVL